jgi:uncharacterized protein YpmB
MREILFWLIGFPFVLAFILGFMSYAFRESATPTSQGEAEIADSTPS